MVSAMNTSAAARTAGSPTVVSTPGSGSPSDGDRSGPGQRGQPGRDQHRDRGPQADQPGQARPGAAAGLGSGLGRCLRHDTQARRPRRDPRSGSPNLDPQAATLPRCSTTGPLLRPGHRPVRGQPADLGGRPAAGGRSGARRVLRRRGAGRRAAGRAVAGRRRRPGPGRTRPGSGPRPTALPVRTSAVDGFALLLALPRLPDLDGLFAELRRVLRPGGTLVLLVPSAVRRSVLELRLSAVAGRRAPELAQPVGAGPGRVAARGRRLRGARRRPGRVLAAAARRTTPRAELVDGSAARRALARDSCRPRCEPGRWPR